MSTPVTSVTQERKYAEIIQAWDGLWSLEDRAHPLWLVPTSPVLTAAMTGLVPIPQLLQDKEVQLNAQLALLNWRESADLGDAFVPHLQPQAGVTVFASAFGCQVDFFKHTLPWAHPVIRECDPPEKVYDLPPPRRRRRAARRHARVYRLLRRANSRPLPGGHHRHAGPARYGVPGMGVERLHGGDVH